MKTLSLIVALTVLAGVVPANADLGNPPKPVTFNAKTITPDTSVESIKKGFTDSTESTRQQRPNGDTYLVLSNNADGTYSGLSGSGSAKVHQYTTLALVVGKDGKIKSYDMVQRTERDYGEGNTSWTTTQMPKSCFADCDQSADKTLTASLPPVKNTPPKAIASQVVANAIAIPVVYTPPTSALQELSVTSCGVSPSSPNCGH